MTRLGARAVVTIVVWAMLVGSGLASSVLAQTAPDKSEVVLVLDFSGSILEDETIRNRFGAAIERIADRVDATALDLIAGDATVTIVQFATSAADQPGCTDLKLLSSPSTVARFSACLRLIAGAYRKGPDPELIKRIGIDTNYVAAMEQAAKHLPPTAVRPALILFTDGKHDVKGVPVSQVQVTFQRLFGTRSPLALLPVGMGLDPKDRSVLEAGLFGIKVIRAMPPCVSGTPFEWPSVVFESPDEAGTAVAVALQDATCTFTVEASPSPTQGAGPGVVGSIRLTPEDGRVELAWTPPVETGTPIVDYRIRCRADDGEPIESTEGVSLETKATVEGLMNGTAYTCEVAAVTASSEGAWTAADSTITPVGIPAAPAKPAVVRLDRGLEISVNPGDPAQVSGYHYECSPDSGGTWPAEVDVSLSDNTAGQIGGLTNGVGYVCRAFALNLAGRSDASPLSDAVTPCGSTLECNSTLLPILAIFGVLAALGLFGVLAALLRGRTRGYVVAVVDVVHTANLGSGSSLGISFVRAPHNKSVTDIVPDRGRKAEIKIHHGRGDRFDVKDRTGRHATTSGESLVVVDSLGVKHELVLWAFATNSALAASGRR
jgi:hypothetical protein